MMTSIKMSAPKNGLIETCAVDTSMVMVPAPEKPSIKKMIASMITSTSCATKRIATPCNSGGAASCARVSVAAQGRHYVNVRVAC
jgi:hypothetical protein